MLSTHVGSGLPAEYRLPVAIEETHDMALTMTIRIRLAFGGSGEI